MAVTQPDVATALAGCEPGVTWTTARDGSLWARGPDGQWVAGCSVPRLAGRALLRTLAVEPGGHCLLAPAHAGLIAAARERLGAAAVLFVVQPDGDRCRLLLRCGDWSADISAGRLWFAAGEGWSASLAAAFVRHPGLASPGRFIRTRLTSDAETDPLIAEAQRVFGAAASARSAELDRLRQTPPPPPIPGRVLVIAGSRFRLWDDPEASLLAAVPAGSTVVRYDTDDPLTAAPLALAAAAAGCSAVLAADAGRADAADVVPGSVPWVTWVTRPAIPRCPDPRDGLVVADPGWVTAAGHAGWPAGRVRVAAASALDRPPRPAAPATLSLIADVPAVERPDSVKRFSTHVLLWEAIAAELHDDPLAAGDAEAYLASRAGRMALDADQLDRPGFVAGLIRPAFTLGLARLLVGAGLPLRVWGDGWDRSPEFHAHVGGPVTTRAEFTTAVDASAVLVRPTPGRDWHPVQACGRPVLASDGRGPEEYVRRARQLLASRVRPSRAAPTLGQAIAGLVLR